MNCDQGLESQAGYALLDVLVGLAISSIVLGLSVTGMRNAAALHQRYELETSSRRDVMAAYMSLERLLEHKPPYKRDGQTTALNGEVQVYPLGGREPGPVSQEVDPPMTLKREVDAKQHRVSLVLETRLASSFDNVPILRNWHDINMIRRDMQYPHDAGELSILIFQTNGSEFAHLRLSHPITVDAHRVAVPFGARPRPGGRHP